MKIVEVTKSFSVAITNEEADLFIKFDTDTPMMKRHEMTEQQIITANQLVNKDLLIRKKNEDGQIIYRKRTGR